MSLETNTCLGIHTDNWWEQKSDCKQGCIIQYVLSFLISIGTNMSSEWNSKPHVVYKEKGQFKGKMCLDHFFTLFT